MSWFKLDDGFFHHPKVVQAGRDARDLWLAAGCYCAKELTDGVIPTSCLPLLAAEAQVSDPTALAARLVTLGLLEERDDGFLIHDYLAYNPSRAKVLAARERNARRLAEWRAAKRSGNVISNGVTSTVSNTPSNALPVPLPHDMPAAMASSQETDMAGDTCAPRMARASPSAPGRDARDELAKRRRGLVAALGDVLGFAAQSAGERRRLETAAVALARADPPVEVAELAAMKTAWEANYDARCTPWTLADHVGELRQLAAEPPAPPGRSNGRRRRDAVFRDDRSAAEKAAEPVRRWRDSGVRGAGT